MSICILADAADIDRAKQIELEYMSVDDLKKCVFLVFHSFIMVLIVRIVSGSTRTRSSSRSSPKNMMPSWLLRLLIKQIPRLLGPGLSKGTFARH
jgi:large subunit ribosomal protein L10Ae